jgi:(1->4)-alpha-D-glucan 1-alpha-D-glucosylmutase
MLKAVREAKLRTSWTDPDPDFEAALLADVEALLSPARSPRFLDDLERWVARIARPGLRNAAARTVLHLASPGIPDLYQGDELWNLALVDPDNRRPVDYRLRQALLEEVERGASAPGQARRRWLGELMASPEDGRLKLHLIRSALAARRDRPGPFRSRAYRALRAEGPARDHLVAFGRGEGQDRLLVVVPRRPADPSLWRNTTVTLPPAWPGRWRCVLSGEPVEAGPDGLPAEVLLGILPASLLLVDAS